MAARKGLKFAWSAGFRRVHLERDAYTSIQGAEDDLSYSGSILRDIVMYPSWFFSFNSGFIPKECNRVAHYLTHMSTSEEIGIWLELTYLLTNDFGF